MNINRLLCSDTYYFCVGNVNIVPSSNVFIGRSLRPPLDKKMSKDLKNTSTSWNNSSYHKTKNFFTTFFAESATNCVLYPQFYCIAGNECCHRYSNRDGRSLDFRENVFSLVLDSSIGEWVWTLKSIHDRTWVSRNLKSDLGLYIIKHRDSFLKCSLLI